MANSLYWGVLVEFIFWMLNSHVHFFVIVVVVSVIYVVNMHRSSRSHHRAVLIKNGYIADILVLSLRLN